MLLVKVKMVNRIWGSGVRIPHSAMN